MLLSYLFYFVIKPEGRTNYGVILDPRSYPMPKLDARLLGGEPKELDAYHGKWIMLQADSGDCAEACKKKLYDMRQLRLIQGKEMERIERVWLITDDKPVDTVLIREYDGTRMLTVNVDKLKSWLPSDSNTSISDHIYMIDPLGNLMMRFPKDADPNRIKKDIAKLLKASAIG
ncbi:cytochrome C oxidase subunit I [Undibacterium sp. Jales W-56]|uniref:SCO family protein n=1 Tax=Undibacterium sp. Jales W-56 TaxID=2897325 RepID=UPI0021D06AE1|nr:cytochrome C oxidase subunit I [Undibacterium sp. Jales W-56]MCU6435041.1 cytochrome C oxidase subunit I [Undibacterium sp. Jales W-56]